MGCIQRGMVVGDNFIETRVYKPIVTQKAKQKGIHTFNYQCNYSLQQ